METKKYLSFPLAFNLIWKNVKELNPRQANAFMKNMWLLYGAVVTISIQRNQNPVKINQAYLVKKFNMQNSRIKYYLQCLETIKLIKRNIAKGRYGKNQVKSIFISGYYPKNNGNNKESN